MHSNDSPARTWRASFHGGHSGPYCDHAQGPPEPYIAAAHERGLCVFGFTEHAPRLGDEFIYPDERAMGWGVADLERMFTEYAAQSRAWVTQAPVGLTVLRGFEIEVVPHDRYVEIMQGYRETHGFDYIVGSVHHIEGIIIDYTPEVFGWVVDHCGSVEKLAIRYYNDVAAMVAAMRPEIVAHLDLVRKNAPNEESVATPSVRAAAMDTLDVIAENGGILDVNTAGYRKGLGRPYPAPWLVEAALSRGIGFALGDDSHRVDDVGAGFDEARDYLFGLGVEKLTHLDRDGAGRIVRVEAPL